MDHLNPFGNVKKDFPESFIKETKENEIGHSLCTRRDNERTIIKRVNGDYIDVTNQ